MSPSERPASPERSDRDLVLRFKDGCPDAYESIYRRHHERVYRTCLRILGNPSDAAEAAQETFLKAFKALGRFNGQYQLGAWLARIASNVAVDQVRARQRSVNIVAGTEDVVHLEDDRRRLDTEIAERIGVQETLGEIQPLHAEALRLQAVEGLSHRQIAARLHMSPPQVKSLLHRSRHSFKRAWDNASGWALAPLGFIKPMRSRNASTDSLMSVSPATGVMLERIAASAMAAVVAVAGFAGSRGDSQQEPLRRAPSFVTPKVAEDDLGAPKARRAEPSTGEVLQPSSMVRAAKKRVTTLLAFETVLPEEIEAPEDDGAEPQPPAPPSAKKPLPKEVRKVVKRVEDAVPGTPPHAPNL